MHHHTRNHERTHDEPMGARAVPCGVAWRVLSLRYFLCVCLFLLCMCTCVCGVCVLGLITTYVCIRLCVCCVCGVCSIGMSKYKQHWVLYLHGWYTRAANDAAPGCDDVKDWVIVATAVVPGCVCLSLSRHTCCRIYIRVCVCVGTCTSVCASQAWSAILRRKHRIPFDLRS